MPHHQSFQITGFHSCNKEVGVKVLNGEIDLKPSSNAWDWLGQGIYFWESSLFNFFEVRKQKEKQDPWLLYYPNQNTSL